MGEPVVVNGVTISMSDGTHTKNSAFTLGSTKVRAGGLPVVLMTSLLGGLTFTATIKTVKTKISGGVIPLVGSSVTDSAGYTGVISSPCGAGTKYSAT